MSDTNSNISLSPWLTEMPVFEVDRAARVRLQRASACEQVRDLTPYDMDIEEFLGHARREVGAALGVYIHKALARFRLDPTAPGTLLLRKLPVTREGEDLALTPADGGRSPTKSNVSELTLLGVASLLGEPFAMRTEKNGDLVHTIAPVKGRETRQANDGARRFVSHVEHAYREPEERLDTLLLFCLRPDHEREAITTFTEIRDVLPHLSREAREILREPLFLVRSPQSIGEVVYSEPRPILTGPEDAPRVCFNLAGMVPQRSYAQRAFDEFAEAVESPDFQQGVKLDSGDLLIINNLCVAHGRSDFTPRYDGFDRYLQRVFVKRDLTAYRPKLVPGSLRLFS
jgi:L-asparagine oxygenase